MSAVEVIKRLRISERIYNRCSYFGSSAESSKYPGTRRKSAMPHTHLKKQISLTLMKVLKK